MRFILGLTLLTGLAFGCGDDDGPIGPDTDAGARDSGTRDSGGGGTDSGPDDGGEPDEDSGTPEDGGGVDSGGGGGCPDLMPTEPAAVIISQINLATREVELFNPRSEPVMFMMHQWCQRPEYGPVRDTGAVTIPPGEYAVHTLPTGWLGSESAARGELAIYASSAFGSTGAIIDFVCWGTNPTVPPQTPTRKDVAEGANIWDGDCAPAPTMGAIVRRPSTAGDGASSYDTTAPFEATSCD